MQAGQERALLNGAEACLDTDLARADLTPAEADEDERQPAEDERAGRDALADREVIAVIRE